MSILQPGMSDQRQDHDNDLSGHQSMGLSMDQSLDQSLNQSMDHSLDQSLNQSMNQSLDQSANVGNTRWRWNHERDLALIELVHKAAIWNVKYGQTTSAWNAICDGLASHPSSGSQKSSRPSCRTAQVRYYELIDKFRATMQAALLNNQLPIISGRLDELMHEIDEQTVPGKTKGTPHRIYMARSFDDTVDDQFGAPHTPVANSALSLSNGRVLQAKHEEEFTADSDYSAKRRRTEASSPFNLSQYQPALQQHSTFHATHGASPAALESSQLSQLIAQNHRLIEMYESHLRAAEEREKLRAEQEERQARLLQAVQDDIRQIYGKIISLLDDASTGSHQARQMTSEMMNQHRQ